MKKEFQKIWDLAVPYLEQGTMKDFVLHTKYVVKSMEMIIAGEGGDANILISAAILHDVGWSKVAPEFQSNADLGKKCEGQKQHIGFAKEIIEEILTKLNYKKEDIDHIVSIVESHKFQNPEDKDKQMLIDADNLSDTFKEQFDSDVKAYKSTPEQVYEYRTRNEYYAKTAKKIAKTEMAKRLKEIN